MQDTHQSNHGAFYIHLPREDRIILHLYERAAQNKEQPGEAWTRVETIWEAENGPERGFKEFHLDTNLQLLEITESWGGVETARRTVDLGDDVH